MKLLIIGDSHGNIANLKHVMGFAKSMDAKAVIHTGDWNTLKSLETVFNYNIPIYTVLGNADIDPKLARRVKDQWLKIKLGDVNIGIVHKLTISHQPLIIGCDIVFTGHYHSQKEWEIDGVKIVRCGALENKIEFAVFDTKTKIIEFVNHDKV